MECREFRKVLREYLDGELEHDKKLLVEKHLALCNDCREAVLALKGFFASIASEPGTELRPFFTEKILARVRSRKRKPLLLRPVPALASIMILVLASVTIIHFTGTTKRMPPALQVVYPEENSIVLGDKLDICASVSSSSKSLKKEKLQLLLDGKDVTQEAEIGDEYLIYTPGRRIDEGEHTILIRAANGAVEDVLKWRFYSI
ncbi:MAG: zf-HC2 domain-containing protein [Candidatus Eisenbacteria bacterium]|nr:zf-HC2 domain-containing protein [Candidatus Eisenbacteria bacterium]